MTALPPDRWPEIERLFAATVGLTNAEADERLHAVEPALAAEVRALLDADRSAGEGLDAPPSDLVHTLIAEAAGGLQERAHGDDRDLPPGTRVGPWAVEEEIGWGGMGVVYRARRADGLHRQTVALKVVKRGMDSAAVVRRFGQERVVLAGLSHDGIARLLDGGTTPDGRPYFALELVDGVTLTVYADRERLGVEARVRLFLQVCDAVAYAHRRLVVHRDLKPSNVLVTPDGRAKLLDFGVARLLDGAPDLTGEPLGTITGDGPRPMTPEYASPEQIDGAPVTTAVDVYALGVLFYELLTGRRPHSSDGRAPAALAASIRAAPPLRPSTAAGQTRERRSARGETRTVAPVDVAEARGSTPERLRNRLRGDLDAVALKALRPEPEARYASVDALADDLRRHLGGRPIGARDGTARYVAGAFVRRHRWGVAVGALIVALLAGTVAVVAVQNGRVARERDRASDEAAEAAAVADFLETLLAASDPAAGLGREPTVRSVLDEGARRLTSDLAGQPDVQARMMSVVGSAYTALGRYREAARLLTMALARQRARLGPDAPGALDTQEALADLASEHDDLARAGQLLRDALARRERTDAGSVATARTRARLGTLYADTGRPAEAERLLRLSIARLDAAGPTSARDSDDARSALARALSDRGALARADTLLTRVVARTRARSGPAHPDLSTALVNLAGLRFRQRRFADAERLARRAEAIAAAAYGPRHVRTAEAQGERAAALLALGRSTDAEALYRRLAAFERETFGGSRHQLAVAQSELGLAAFFGHADTTAAREHLRQAVALLRGSSEWRTPGAATILWNFASVAEADGDPAAAAAAYREALATYTATTGADSPDTHDARKALGRVLAAQGACAEGVPLLRAELSPAGTPGSAYTADARSHYGACLARMGRTAEARTQLRAAVALFAADTTARAAPDPRARLARQRLAALGRLPG